MEDKIVKAEQPIVNVGTLVVAKPDKQIIALGDMDSFVKFVKTVPIQAILWNEDHLIAMTGDRSTILAYRPEIEPTTQMFFSRDKRGRRDDEGNDIRVWAGEYAPVEFQKGQLIKFIKTYAGNDNKALTDSIKSMKVVDKVASNSELLDLGTGEFDDGNVRTVEEETSVTNIPSKFSLKLPVMKDYYAEFAFEAKVIKADPRDYDNPNKGKRVIQLRVLNAREVMRGIMYDVIGRIPDVPAYYGRTALKKNDD